MTARYRFGGVEFDAGTGALEPLGTRLPRQPARLLELLIEKRGAVVSRREIRDELWSDTTVEYDKSLHFCVHQVRTALGDSASEPRFVETIPRRGYRLMPEVERVDGVGATSRVSGANDARLAEEVFDPQTARASVSGAAETERTSGTASRTSGRLGRRLIVPAGLGLLALLAAIALPMSGFFGTPADDAADDPNAAQAAPLEAGAAVTTDPAVPPLPAMVRIGVMPFEPPADWVHGSVPHIAEWILEELTIDGQGRAWIVGPSTTAAYAEADTTLAELAADYDLDYIVNGRFLSDAEPPAMLAELIRASDGAHIWVQRIERFDDGRGLGLEISAAVRERLLGPGQRTVTQP